MHASTCPSYLYRPILVGCSGMADVMQGRARMLAGATRGSGFDQIQTCMDSKSFYMLLWRNMAAVVQGKVRMLAGAKCGYMPLAAPPGRLAFMSLGDEELDLYFAKHPRNYEVRGSHACQLFCTDGAHLPLCVDGMQHCVPCTGEVRTPRKRPRSCTHCRQ